MGIDPSSATAGYSTVDGVLGEVSLTERNFLGRGQYLRAAIGASQSGRTFDFSFTEPRFMGLKVSAGLDAYLPVPDSNPLTPAKIALGKQLFFDRRLSRDQTIACSTCHQPEYAFSDPHPLARITGAPSLVDGRLYVPLSSLE